MGDALKGSPVGRASGGRLAGIEGVRALAATSVLVFHVWLYGYLGPTVAPGLNVGFATKFFQSLSAGVTLFFVLSGFLLYRPFANAVLNNNDWPSVGRYFRNRALRILPAYWFILAAVTVFFQRDFLSSPLRITATALFAREWIPAYATPNGPVGLTDGRGEYGIGPAWSLAIEVCFYIALPVLSLGALWLGRRRNRRVLGVLAPVLLMVVTGVIGQVAARAEPVLGNVWAHSFPPFAGYFGAGMALAVAYVAWDSGKLMLPGFTRHALLVTGIAIGAIGLKLWYSGPLNYIESQGVIAVGLALMLGFVILSPQESRSLRLLQWRPVVATGLASYSVFLWHDPILRELRDAGLTAPGKGGFVVNLVLVGACTAVAAAFTYRFVEKPALAWKRSWIPGAGKTSAQVDPPRPRPGDSRPVDVIALVETIATRLDPNHQVDIRIDIEPGRTLQVVPRVLEESVGNLIDNALRYGEQPITISLESESGEARLVVEDAGRGITTEFEQRLFLPGSRSEASSAASPDRAGLGPSRLATSCAKSVGTSATSPVARASR